MGWIFAGLVLPLKAAAPTGISLSANIAMENGLAGDLVGDFTAVDPDPGEGHLFTLVEGTGAADNNGFLISGNHLTIRYGVRTADGVYLDYETDPRTFSIRVKTTDSTGLSFEKIFIILMGDDRTEDVDGDGLTEASEEDLHGTSDLVFDTDHDGFGDGPEVFWNSSPTNAVSWPNYPIIGWGENRKRELRSPFDGDFTAISTGRQHSIGLKRDGKAVAWGGPDHYGQGTVPSGLDQLVAVAAGGDFFWDDEAHFWQEDTGHSLVLKNDGTVVEWGFSDLVKIPKPADLSGVVAIAAGCAHSLALKSNGTVVAWGHNLRGEAAVPEGLSDVIAIAAGDFYSLALKNDGSVAAWGENFDGEIWKRAEVPAGLHDVVAISAGRYHALALESDGKVVAWGYNHDGQATVPAGLDHVVSVSAGGFHSMVLKDDGSVKAWGANWNGQTTLPPSAQGQVKMISAGMLHSLALRGTAAYPEIAGSREISTVPGAAVNYQIVVSNAVPSHFSALGLPAGLVLNPLTGFISGSVSGAVRMSVQLIADTNQGRLTRIIWLHVHAGSPPVSISLGPAAVVENSPAGTVVGTLTASDPDEGDSHVFELVSGSGSADNSLFVVSGNQLLVKSPLTRDFEVSPGTFSVRVRARDGSLNQSEQVIALEFIDDLLEDADHDGLTEAGEALHGTSDLTYDSDGDGFGDGFEVGHGTSPASATSFPAGQILVAWGNPANGRTVFPAGLGTVRELAAGGAHGMALKSDGRVAAWGSNENGQCQVPQDLENVVAIAAGGAHGMALKSDGTVAAWGANADGQSTVPPTLTGVAAISAGDKHSLALKQDGTVTAWGSNSNGQSAVPQGLSGVVAIAAGGYHSLALKSDGSVVSWGAVANATPEGLERVVAIAAGGLHSLALRADGSIAGWGETSSGQRNLPAGSDFTGIRAGWQHCIALGQNGIPVAWGANTAGQSTVPPEATRIQRFAAGGSHNLALRQASGFPRITGVGSIIGWPGQAVSAQISVTGATPAHFSAMGLPEDLTIHPLTGLITGTVVTGVRRAARITVDTDQGRLSRTIWVNTLDGSPPAGITLVPVPAVGGEVSLQENTPAGTLVGTLGAVDPDAGDTHTFNVIAVGGSADPYCFETTGNQLRVRTSAGIDYEASSGNLTIRVRAYDAAMHYYEQDFAILLTDDRTEDADGDGVNEAKEEDVFLTSDVHFDNFATADADLDGVPVLIEYAFNLNLQVPDAGHYLGGTGSTSGLPLTKLVTDTQGHRRLRIEYLRRIGSGLIYQPQFSSGLNTVLWTPAAQVVTVIPINAEWERCVVDDDQFTTAAAVRFGRVKVSQ